MATEQSDLYSRITARIVADLENGVRPWIPRWRNRQGASRPLRHDGRPYRGINVLTLWSEAMAKGYGCLVWMTGKQIHKLGGEVRSGETGTPVVFAGTMRRAQLTDDGRREERNIMFLRDYLVYNLEQTAGLPAAAATTPLLDLAQRIERAENFFASTGVDLRHGGDAAFYMIPGDYVQMPPFAAFTDAEAYYATLAHEMIHWTSPASRVNRRAAWCRRGRQDVAAEELVAELGAAFVVADLGITAEVRADHSAYIGSWLRALRNDRRAIFTAAAHAQRAVDYLHGCQPKAGVSGNDRQAA